MKNEDILNENNGKKFDICLMNPPYAKGLHYKFIQKTNEISKNVISIQPVPWLLDATAKHNEKSMFSKLKDKCLKRLNDLEIIKLGDAEKIFDAGFVCDIGIYVFNDEGGYDIDKLNSDSIIDKIIKYAPNTLDNILKMTEPKNCIIISRIIGGNGGRSSYNLDVYGDNYKTCIFDKEGKRLDNGLTFYENRLKTAWGNVKPKKEQLNIKFDTIDECINFFKFTKTYIFRYIVNKSAVGMELNRKVLPFMNDYKEEWTNKRLYEYFKLDDKEIEYIENYIDNKLKELEEFNKEIDKNKKRKKK